MKISERLEVVFNTRRPLEWGLVLQVRELESRLHIAELLVASMAVDDDRDTLERLYGRQEAVMR